MNKVVLGVTGSIAAYKAAYLTSALVKRGISVKVILTKNASEFVGELTFESLSHQAVACDMFEKKSSFDIEHIALAKWADLFVVAPADANIIAKYACGIADDMLSTTLLATKAKVIIAPAMNTAMYENPATVENMEKLKKRGVVFIEPESGALACGDVGKGRMAEPEFLAKIIGSFFEKRKDYLGKKLLVSAGATIEPIDPVRYITNRSTGKMGVAIATAASDRGAQVTLIAGSVSVDLPKESDNMRIIRVKSSAEMLSSVKNSIDSCDAFISAAAPADFTPEFYSDRKIKKADNCEGMQIKLIPCDDILKAVSDNIGNRVHIGFAAETNDWQDNAEKKLKSKHLDAIALNDVSGKNTGFACDTNDIALIFKDGKQLKSGLMTKKEVADWLLTNILPQIKEKNGNN